MGHADIISVSVDGWRHDPSDDELVDDEVRGHAAVDVSIFTSSMAVVFRSLGRAPVQSASRPRLLRRRRRGSRRCAHGQVGYPDHRPETIRTTYLSTREMITSAPEARTPRWIFVTVAEKEDASQQLRIRDAPGARLDAVSGSKTTLIAAAAVVQRLATTRPAPQNCPRAVAQPGRMRSASTTSSTARASRSGSASTPRSTARCRR